MFPSGNTGVDPGEFTIMPACGVPMAIFIVY